MGRRFSQGQRSSADHAGAARRARRGLLAAWLLAAAAAAQIAPGEAVPADELERLRAMLAQPGADGREARETAIQQLLGMPQPAAHRILQEALRLTDDPDGVALAILTALQAQVVAAPASQFGGAPAEARRQLLLGYLGATAPLWRTADAPAPVPRDEVLRRAARLAWQRLGGRELEPLLRIALAAADEAGQQLLLRCAADLQQLVLAPVLADALEAPAPAVRAAARRALQLLTFAEEEFVTRAQFDAWFQQHGERRYVDLAEQAARREPRQVARLRDELLRLRVEAARDFVLARTVPTPQIDWTAVQARTLVDDPAVLDACLQALQQALVQGPPADDQSLPRQAFGRALVQRYRDTAVADTTRRALLLEVAAAVTKAEEVELAAEVTGLLLQQLDGADAAAQIAALRGLRRFPTLETRARLLRFAQRLLAAGAPALPQLEATLQTLASRQTPRWTAPGPTDADKAEWLALVRDVCTAPVAASLRDAALNLALSLDAREQRVPEVFDLLAELARDLGRDTKFRATCTIHLQGFRDQPGAVEPWVKAMRELLGDAEADLRQLAAESLAKLPELVDPRRTEWIQALLVDLRDRLSTEPNPRVLRAMVDTLQACGREPQMPEKAIGALNVAIGKLGQPVPAEQQFRVEPLLQALSTIAADPRASGGLWLGACRVLHQFDKRQSLRLLLQSHGAVELAKDVAAADGGLAERARQAMQWIVRTALLKPGREPWTATEDLQREARHVQIAFAALDGLDETWRLDDAPHRLLRLEVEVALGAFKEAAQRGTAWLQPGNGAAAKVVFDAPQADRLRALVAEAQLGLGKADLAARLLAERDPSLPQGARLLDLQGRVGKALLASDPAAGVALLERLAKATPPEDPALRARVVDWATAALRELPQQRAAVLAELERLAPLFAAQDCPADLREQFQALRGSR